LRDDLKDPDKIFNYFLAEHLGLRTNENVDKEPYLTSRKFHKFIEACVKESKEEKKTARKESVEVQYNESINQGPAIIDFEEYFKTFDKEFLLLPDKYSV